MEWGVFDCCLGLIAGWVDAERGVDCAAPFRGRYRSPRGAQRLIAQYGGLDVLIDTHFGPLGISQTAEAAPGDVGVVRWNDVRGERVCAAIKTKLGWAALRERGLNVAPAPVVMAWRI